MIRFNWASVARTVRQIADKIAENTFEDAPAETPVYTVPEDMIRRAMPTITPGWIEPIQRIFREYNIEGHEAALLLAHLGHESNDMRRLRENMNYSAERLMQVWPSRFRTIEHARAHERNPEKLANAVYGGRMGNTQIGDGWRFIGRGPIQITGRDNYTRLQRDTKLNVLDKPELLEQDKDAGVISACWYWRTYVTARDIEGSTRQINGGLHGLTDRTARFQRAQEIA